MASASVAITSCCNTLASEDLYACPVRGSPLRGNRRGGPSKRPPRASVSPDLLVLARTRPATSCPRICWGKLRRHFDVPATLAPLAERTAPRTAEALAAALAGLGYPGFAYRRPRAFVNPAVLLLAALRSSDLENATRRSLAVGRMAPPRPGLDVVAGCMKVADLQNRLGFVVSLAKQVA